MEVFSGEFLSALVAIVMIDIVLAGDNAILIGLAAKNVPKAQQKKVVIWGTIGAVGVRAVLTLVVVYLLEVPGLRLIGGLLLILIAFKLLTENKSHGDMSGVESFWKAIQTIIIADVLMGLDNVLAVAGAAQGDFRLVLIGLLVSIPIVVWGSTLILKWIDRFPSIVTFGSAILAWTASKMIVHEEFIERNIANIMNVYVFEFIVVSIVVGTGLVVKRNRNAVRSTAE
ncbi:TerC family protein (plasmid) [Rossellomorea sp. AcN35-11]|nr:TerC family protein [Rossellomorea aquimaris]WJV32410.1 TerC family protein [Rossellomorea sp. AcN35-11]